MTQDESLRPGTDAGPEPVYVFSYAPWQLPEFVKHHGLDDSRLISVDVDTDPPMGALFSIMPLLYRSAEEDDHILETYNRLKPVRHLFEERGIQVPPDSLVRELKRWAAWQEAGLIRGTN